MEHVRLVVQNQDRITSEVASLESRASQRLLDVAAAIDADDDERDECDVDLDDLGYDDVRTLGRSQVEAEVLCLRERVAAQTEAIATASSHKFNMDELDGVIGDIQGRKRVIQRRFNVSVPRARVSETAPTLRERSER